MIIRTCVKDAKRILEIYAHYVKNTAITFEDEVPTPDEFQKRIENTLTRYPYLIIEKDGIIQCLCSSFYRAGSL